RLDAMFGGGRSRQRTTEGRQSQLLTGNERLNRLPQHSEEPCIETHDWLDLLTYNVQCAQASSFQFRTNREDQKRLRATTQKCVSDRGSTDNCGEPSGPGPASGSGSVSVSLELGFARNRSGARRQNGLLRSRRSLRFTRRV